MRQHDADIAGTTIFLSLHKRCLREAGVFDGNLRTGEMWPNERHYRLRRSKSAFFLRKAVGT